MWKVVLKLSCKIWEYVSTDVAKDFLTDIFGQHQGTHKFCGLMDCKSPEQFDLELPQLQIVKMYERSSTEAQFHS